MPSQFDHSGQFAAFLEHLADGRGCRFVDAEHAWSMSGHGTPAKKNPRGAASIPRSIASLVRPIIFPTRAK
jgi:hypothetical protein